MKRLGILTGGGDAPGLNAVIRAAVKTAIQEFGYEVYGIKNGFDGFVDIKGVVPLDLQSVRGILPRGGTILGTANRGNPFARSVIIDGVKTVVDYSEETVASIKQLELDALIVVGGDGTLRIAHELSEIGVSVIGVPKTIDNDIGGTDYTFGFDTAINVAMEAIDRLHTTAESHHRVMVLELMGRDAGFITLHAGLAGGADVILIPEIPFKYGSIYKKVNERIKRGTHFSIVVAAEGSYPLGEEKVYSTIGDTVTYSRLGGIGDCIGKYLVDECGIETRVIVLGHLQRGGSPTAFDRGLGTRFGAYAVRLVSDNRFNRMVALKNGEVTDVLLEEALAVPKRVPIDGDAVKTVRSIGISLGDD